MTPEIRRDNEWLNEMKSVIQRGAPKHVVKYYKQRKKLVKKLVKQHQYQLMISNTKCRGGTMLRRLIKVLLFIPALIIFLILGMCAIPISLFTYILFNYDIDDCLKFLAKYIIDPVNRI